MRKFDILHLAESYLPDNFGMARRMASLQAHIGLPTHMIVSNRLLNGQKIEQAVSELGNILITRVDTTIPTFFRKVQIGLLYQLICNRKNLVNAALQKGYVYRIIHGHQGPEFALAASLLATRLNIPFIYEEHMPLTDFSRQLGRPVIMWIREYLLNTADVTIAQTEAAKQKILATHSIAPNKIEVITNGINSEYFNPERHRADGAIIRRAIASGQQTVATYMGYLDSQFNGVDRILELAQDKEIAKHKLLFVFVGDGPMASQIIQIAKTHAHIVYIPPVPPDKVGPIYSLTDVFLLPRPCNMTTSSLFPLKLLEAMAMENIVIGSDLESFKELIKHGETGYIFGESTGLSLKECFLHAISRDTTGLKKQARRLVLQRFDWCASSQKLEAIYKRYL